MADDTVLEPHQYTECVTSCFTDAQPMGKSPDGTISRMKEKNIYYSLQAMQRNAYFYNHKLKDYGIHRMVEEGHFREYSVPIKANKIFCSEWLSERAIVAGTKCNKLLVYDVFTREIIHIPSLKGSSDSLPLQSTCGIHALAVNPSRTMLVTGGDQSNLVAVYSLPTFDPICSGDDAHKDWIFDIKWLDDEFFVSGSRDNTIALWKVPAISKRCDQNFRSPYHAFTKPKVIQACNSAKKVRALAFKPDCDLAAISLNGYLHVFDLKTFEQKCSKRLPFREDNICLSYYGEKNVYVVGSQRNVTFLDCSNLTSATKIDVQHDHCGIRSLSVRGNILSAGTATGSVLFYDIRTGNCVEKLSCAAKNFSLFEENSALSYPARPALFSHSYDSSGTRIFVGGGPLVVDLYGCYAALWQ